MNIKSVFAKMFGWLPRLFSGRRIAQLQRTANIIADLAERALPAIKMVAALTPTPTDDVVLLALERLGMTAAQVLDASNDLLHDASRQRLAAEIIKVSLVRAVQERGVVKIGDLILDTVEDVLALDKSTLLAAVQSAFVLWKTLK